MDCQQGVFKGRMGASQPHVQPAHLIDAVGQQANGFAVAHRQFSLGVLRQQLAGEGQ